MKGIIFALMLCMGASLVSAQEVYTSTGRPDHPGHVKKEKKKKGYDPSRLILGGGIVAGFGDGFADFGVSPFAGYRFTDRVSAGVGLGYEYYKFQQYLYDQNTGGYQNYPTQANIIYPSVWTRVFLWRNLYAIGNYEYDIMNFNDYNYDVNSNVAQEKYNLNVSCLLLGLGLRQPITGRLALTVEVMYDVLQNANSPYYGAPVLRAGLCVGL